MSRKLSHPWTKTWNVVNKEIFTLRSDFSVSKDGENGGTQDLSENTEPPTAPWYLSVLDSAWALFVCFPVLCLYWRGSWSLLSYYVLPGHEPVNDWIMSAVGSMYVVTFWFLPKIEASLENASRTRYYIATRALLMYQGILFMFLWRGMWGLAEHYLGHNLLDDILWLFATLIVLILLGCLRSTLWPPYFIVLDTRKDLLKPSLRFGFEPSDGRKYVADTMFTGLVVLPICIICWKSSFVIMEITIFPDDALLSDIVCVVWGTVGTILLFALQRPIGEVSHRLERNGRHYTKLVWEDFMYLVVFVFMTPIWKGLWNLNLRYLITDDCIGGWVNHCAGTVGLLLTQTYSYVGVWGCIVDGDDPGGRAFFPHDFYRSLHRYILKKAQGQTRPCVEMRNPSTKGSDNVAFENPEYFEGGVNTAYQNSGIPIPTRQTSVGSNLQAIAEVPVVTPHGSLNTITLSASPPADSSQM